MLLVFTVITLVVRNTYDRVVIEYDRVAVHEEGEIVHPRELIVLVVPSLISYEYADSADVDIDAKLQELNTSRVRSA
jgi:hypothetical protein